MHVGPDRGAGKLGKLGGRVRAAGRPRHACAPAMTATASSPPASAVTNPTSGTPPSGAYPVNGDAVWLNPSRPHGNPPNGTRPRTNSSAIHSPAVHTGQPRRRATNARPVPSGAKYSASKRLSATHASMPTGRSPSYSGKENASPYR